LKREYQLRIANPMHTNLELQITTKKYEHSTSNHGLLYPVRWEN